MIYLLVFNGLTSRAQPVLNLQLAPSSNRLSENATRCMVQDQKGFIWVGTIDGLNRYDGLAYELYYHDPSDTSTISNNYITCLLSDPDGRLWVGTPRGVDLYDERYNRFIRLSSLVSNRQALAKQYVTDLEMDQEGRLWISSYDGLVRYDIINNSLEKASVDSKGSEDATIQQDVVSMCKGAGGRIWLGYENGWISQWRNGTYQHYQVFKQPTSIQDIFEDQEGKIWLGTGLGIHRFDPLTQQATKYGEGRTWDIYDMAGETWINVNLGGILSWDKTLQQLVPVTVIHDGQEAVGDMKAFFRDRQGIVWSSYHGLYKVDRFERRMDCIRHEKGNLNTPAEPFIRKVMVDEKGNHVVLTINQGVNYFNRETNQWRHFNKQHQLHNERRMFRTVDMVMLGSKVYVLCQDLLYSLDIETGEIEKLVAQSIGDQEGANLLLLNNGNLLIGGRQVFIYQVKSKKLQTIVERDDPIADGFRFCYGRDDQIWGVSKDAIYHFDQNSYVLNQRYQIKVSDELSSILGFVQGSNDEFWIGHRGGLIRLETTTGKTKSYTTQQGLPNSTINSLLLDNRGNLWIGTNKGISVLDPKTDNIRLFDRSNGIQDEIFLTNCAHKSPDGRLFLGGVNGYNYFSPDSLLQSNPTPPSIWLKDLRLADQSRLPLPSSLMGMSIGTGHQVKLPYRSRSISLELIAIGLSHSVKNEYACQLEGVDQQWNYLGKNPKIAYSHLPYGQKLIFKAKAANSDGLWSTEKVLFELYITPPFWAQTWFQILIAFAILGISFSYYRWRLKAVKQQNLKLQRAVTEQTAEIENQAQDLRLANEDLRQQSTIINEQVQELNRLNKTQSQLFVGLSHEFRTPITLMLANLEALEDNISAVPLLQKLEGNANQLLQLVNELLDVARLDSGTYPLHVREGKLFDHLSRMVEAFRIKAQQQGIELRLEVDGPTHTPLYYDLEVLGKIVNNLLSNALKFTPEGWIVVKASLVTSQQDDWELLLQIADSGIGIDQDQLPYIFDRFYQADAPTITQKQGTGIGLNLVQQLVHLHQGSINVESQVGEGSCFTINLPIATRSYSQAKNLPGTQAPPAGLLLATNLGAPPALDIDSENNHQKLAPEDAPTILIVEDNEDIRSFIGRCLSRSYALLEAADGNEGLKLAKENIPDIIISDVLMPGMDGFTLCEQLKSDVQTSHIPVILLTALSERENLIRGLHQGADVYLSKPFHKEELQLRVKNLLIGILRIREHFLREKRDNKLPSGLSPLDQQLMERIHQLLSAEISNEHLSVEMVCKAAQLSRSQLFRKLKALTGMSVTEYIRDYRLRKAHELILAGAHSITEVIHATGFNSRSYFYNSFRQKYQLTPTELRRQLQS
ncbi:MAG: response regulator [Saprospiraceae bacterium]|nr:response regulator [Saprospiraceae bacterium]